MSFYLFKDSFKRYKNTSNPLDADLLANMRQRYTSTGGVAIDSTGGLSGSRVELGMQNGGIAKTTPHSARWVLGHRYRYNATTLANGLIYQAFNNDANLFGVQQNADGTMLISSNGVPLGVTDRSLFSNTRYFLEWDFALSGGSPIIVTGELRINGHVEATGSGSTGRNASSMLSYPTTGGVDANRHAFSAATGGAGTGSWITDLYIKNEAGYEGDIRNLPMYPASDGGILDWTPNSGSTHYDRVNTHPVDITKWLETATPGNIDLWGFSGIPAFSGTIVGINISVLVQKDDEGTKSFKIVVGSTGTDAESDEFFVSTTNAEYYEFSLKEDPLTGLPWTLAGVNALIAGVKCIS